MHKETNNKAIRQRFIGNPASLVRLIL